MIETIEDALLSDTVRSALAKCKKTTSDARSLPPEVYADPEILLIEIARIFRKHWLCIGRTDRLKNLGDYVTLDFSNQSVIALRDHSGLRAFANSCRHRNARLLSGDGNISRISCPLHNWTYKLDGDLSGAPHMNKVASFSKTKCSLRKYHIAESMGFLFICLADTAPGLGAIFRDFRAIHSPWPIDTLVSKRHRSFEVSCNWKAFLDIFNEYYHLPVVHPNSLDEIYKAPEPADFVESGSFATQFGYTLGRGGLLGQNQQQPLPLMPNLTGREAAGVRYTWLFPNMTFAAGVDALWMYEAYPVAVDRCLVRQTACFPTETVQLMNFDELVAAYYHRLDVALDEDILALNNQQIGLSCGDALQGRFQPLLESNVASFASWYANQLLP